MNDTATTPADQLDEHPGVVLSPAELALTREKIAKINARAEKRGFTGRFEITAERFERTTRNELGFDITEVLYRAKITGETPKYNDWTFLARVDRVADSFTIATAPGVEYVDRDLVRAGHCDHCGIDRDRNNTYLVRHTDGTIKNVGSTCIKDFLGWTGNFAFISEEDVERDCFGVSGTGERTYTVETVLAAAHAATRAFGWVPSSAAYGQPTSAVVRLLIGAVRPTRRDIEALAPARAYIDEAKERAAIVKAWVLSEEFSGRSTYVDNLKVAVAAEEIGWKLIGIVASAPQAYTRHLESAAERAAREAQWAAEKAARETAQAASVFLGKPKDKIVVKGTLAAIKYIEGDYGTTVLYTVLTAEGNLVKWFASSEYFGDKEGVEVHFRGTVKDLDEFKGTKATVVTRCININPATGEVFSAHHTAKHNKMVEIDDEWVYPHQGEGNAHPDCEWCYKLAHNIDLG
jgi:hypothetical protein